MGMVPIVFRAFGRRSCVPQPPRLAPSARPGTRAPHCWITNNRSTLDLFGNGFVLFCFGAHGSNVRALTHAAEDRGVPLEVIDLDHPEAAVLFERRFVLVRPDGHIAWRGDRVPDNAVSMIDQVRGA